MNVLEKMVVRCGVPPPLTLMWTIRGENVKVRLRHYIYVGSYFRLHSYFPEIW